MTYAYPFSTNIPSPSPAKSRLPIKTGSVTSVTFSIVKPKLSPTMKANPLCITKSFATPFAL